MFSALIDGLTLHVNTYNFTHLDDNLRFMRYILCKTNRKEMLMKRNMKRLILGNIFFSAAVVTLLPGGESQMINLAGYKSICRCAPVCSVILLGFAVYMLITLR